MDKTSSLPSDHPALIWRPMPEAWAQLANNHPELCLGRTATAQANFRVRHGAALRAAGILSRGPHRGYWVDTTRFDRAFFLLIAGRPLGDLAQTGSQVSPL